MPVGFDDFVGDVVLQVLKKMKHFLTKSKKVKENLSKNFFGGKYFFFKVNLLEIFFL